MLYSDVLGRAWWTSESWGKGSNVDTIGRDTREGVPIDRAIIYPQNSRVAVEERIWSWIRAAFDNVLSENDIGPRRRQNAFGTHFSGRC